MKKQRLLFFQKNTAWIVSIFSVCTISIAFILKFIKYIYSRLFFNYYGINYGLFDRGEIGIVYDFYLSILLFFCFYSLLYCYKEILKVIKEKRNIKLLIKDFLLIVLSNFLISISVYPKGTWWIILIDMIALVIYEIIISIIFFSKKREKYFYLEDEIKYIPFVVIALLLLFSFSYTLSIVNNRTFSLIDDNKVIVYSTNDYYVVLNCEANENELVVHKGEQTKINNTDIESKQFEFDSVIVK